MKKKSTVKPVVKNSLKAVRLATKDIKHHIITDVNYITQFLEGDKPDYQGRFYTDMVNCSDEEMEFCHDQIQYLFPLHEESKFAQRYPVVSKELIENVKDNLFIKNNIISAYNRMELFYGIGNNYDPDRIKEWATPFNHNLLRITRIIRSLRLFGLYEYARNFYFHVLEAVNKTKVSDNPKFEKTLIYWSKAWGDDPWETLN